MLKQANDAPSHDVYKIHIRGSWTEVHCTNISCVILQQDLPSEDYDLLGCYTAEWIAP